MLVLSSPSGAGKTSIARELLAQDNNLQMSVSATTRPRRPGEVHGVDYEFVEPNQFRAMIDGKKLLEYAKVFDY
jgi:guanylate kinase